MKHQDFAISGFRIVAAAVLMASVMRPALAQDQAYNGGVVDDWTHHHVIFSNPGTMEEALSNGTYEKWQRIVSDPRYRLQWLKRNAAWTEQTTTPTFSFPGVPEADPSVSDFKNRNTRVRKKSLHADWSVPLSATSNVGVAPDVYPAKYTFSITGTPSCTIDFVVFPIDGAGGSAQANLVGANNLYSGTCTGTPPVHVLFAYFVGTGSVQTSPVLSLDGTKVAFVESVSGGSIFHVLTIDKSGNSGCPNATPCNGSVFSGPATPGIHNAAVDTKITMHGGVSDTRSSPYVDYDNDVAYVGDDVGNLHKFTGVFLGTPTEAGSPWPFAAGISAQTSPVYDSTSKNIFIGGVLSRLHCVTSAGAYCNNQFITVGSGGILDAPIVDSTSQTVFATANNGTNSILTQTNTALSTQVNATMGASGTDLFDGAFDNAYFTSVSTGHMYFCGNLGPAATPTLLRVGFNGSGTMNASPDPGSFQLVVSGNTGTAVDCSPLTEVFNTSLSQDLLFLSVKNNGFNTGTTNCGNTGCIMSFALPTASPFTFPSAAIATLTNLGSNGTSGIIIDNVSGVAGASQIYFGNLSNQTAVQVSQSALR